MKRLLLALCALLIASPAFAGSMSLLGAGKVSAAGPAYTGPGDIVGSAKAWYGLRAYNSADAAAQVAAIRLNRSSDHEVCDIKVTTAGSLSTTTSNCSGASSGSVASTWCANAGGTCAVDTWYDQTGNGNNMLAGVGPQFVFACTGIGSLPCTQWNGTNHLDGGATSTSQPLTVSTVAYHNSSSTGQNDIIAAANGVFFNSGGGNVGGFFGSSANAAAADNAFHAVQVVVNSSSSVIAVDGTESSGKNFSTGALGNNYFLGAQSSVPTSPLTGFLAEVGLWPSQFTTGAGAQASLVCHNQGAYYSITVTC